MNLVSTLAFAAAIATLRIILQRENMIGQGIGAIGTLLFALAGYVWLSKKETETAEATDPTPASDPSTTLSGPASVEKWINEASRASNLTGVPRDLILAVIWQESGGDPTAVGSAGEQGLMQVTKIAAEDVDEPLPSTKASPQRQITVGAKYLSRCFEYVGGSRNVFKALRCYNEGPPPFTAPASEQYAQQVLEKQKQLLDVQ